MHCPKCGQQQASDVTRFCSRCGFLLTGIAQVVAKDGQLPEPPRAKFTQQSPRRRGVFQGTFIFLLSFLVVPLAAMLTLILEIEPFLPAISAILLTVGGVLRIVYAFMFESGAAGSHVLETNVPAAFVNRLAGKREAGELPPAQSVPFTDHAPPGAGRWRDTDEFAPRGSVTDSTTKLLQREGDQ